MRKFIVNTEIFWLEINQSLVVTERHITKNSRSFCHKKTGKTYSFAKRGRTRTQERRELGTLYVILY